MCCRRSASARSAAGLRRQRAAGLATLAGAAFSSWPSGLSATGVSTDGAVT